jgi:uncharacterized protein Veg
MFDIGISIISFLADIIEKKQPLPDQLVYPLVGALLLFTFIFTRVYTRKKIIRFFVREYPSLFLKRLRKISKSKRDIAYKRIGYSYQDIINFERAYY